MYGMFSSTPFNQDVSEWDVSKVYNKRYMFTQNANFNQDLCLWETKRQNDNPSFVTNMFDRSNCPETADPDLTVNPAGPFVMLA